MTEPLKQFFDAVHDNDVDDYLLHLPIVEKTLDGIEDFGKDLEQSLKGETKKPPVKPTGATPTYAESAFIGPKKENTLYDVTNKEDKVPTITTQSKVSKKIKYNFHSFTFGATYAKKFGVFAGKKLGLKWTEKSGSVTENVQAEYRVRSGKASLSYSRNSSYESYNVSLFNRDGNNGIAGGYRNSEGFNSAFSIDENSASLNIGYEKKLSDCTLNVDSYATAGENYSSPYAGVGVRVTF